MPQCPGALLLIGLGLLVGFRFHSSVGACLAGIALIILFGYAFIWVYAAVGLASGILRRPDRLDSPYVHSVLRRARLSFPWPPCPGGSNPSREQPASVVIDSVRALFEGGPLVPDLWQALAWCLGILAVFFVVSLNLYRRATA